MKIQSEVRSGHFQYVNFWSPSRATVSRKVPKLIPCWYWLLIRVFLYEGYWRVFSQDLWQRKIFFRNTICARLKFTKATILSIVYVIWTLDKNFSGLSIFWHHTLNYLFVTLFWSIWKQLKSNVLNCYF